MQAACRRSEIDEGGPLPHKPAAFTTFASSFLVCNHFRWLKALVQSRLFHNSAMRRGIVPLTLALLVAWLSRCWVAPSGRRRSVVQRQATLVDRSVEDLRWSLLRMAAALDRGQAYNPTSGAYYAERMAVARELLDELLQRPSKNITMEDLDGEWELVFSTVKHGIFRSSPFFLAVQEAFGDQESSELFFKLHELQVCGMATVYASNCYVTARN